MKKKKKIVLMIVLPVSIFNLLLILSPVLYILIYNSTVDCSGFDDNFINELENYYPSSYTTVERFFNEYLDYTKYYTYSTKMYYVKGQMKKFYDYLDYAELSCSFVIDAKDGYDSLLSTIQDENVFIERELIEVDDWCFREIYCNLSVFYNEYYEASFKLRNPSFWLGYNNVKKEVSFSSLVLSYRRECDDDELKALFRNNFYI